MCVLQKFHVPAVALERSRPKNKTKPAKEEMSPLHRRFLFVLSRDGTKELCHFSGRMTYVLVLKTIVKLWQQSCWRSRNTPATIPIFYGKKTFLKLHGNRCPSFMGNQFPANPSRKLSLQKNRPREMFSKNLGNDSHKTRAMIPKKSEKG